jgi:hypothetical protein
MTICIDNASYSVVKKETINYQDLQKLLSGRLAAIRIPKFYSNKLSKLASEKLLIHPDRGVYNKASSIGRLGMAHFEIDNQERFDFYHDNALKHTQQLREVFLPFLSPIDKLRLLLEEIWPAGANLQMLDEKKCAAGICRIVGSGDGLLAHNDRLDRDSPDSQQALSLLGQLAACVYLQVPAQGGGVRLWNKEPGDEEEYTRLKDNNYGIKLEKLGKPQHVIEPSQGELLLFNARKYHGVAPWQEGLRVNVSMFIGYRGSAQALTYWS